jgi:hypothetical protein
MAVVDNAIHQGGSRTSYEDTADWLAAHQMGGTKVGSRVAILRVPLVRISAAHGATRAGTPSQHTARQASSAP